MAKTRIPVARTVGRSIQILSAASDTTATITQAQFQSLVNATTAAISAQNPSGLQPTTWSLITEIPSNIVKIAALSSSGILQRNQDGTWRLIPTPISMPGQDGADGQDGMPGPAGTAGAIGNQGPAGWPGADGVDGQDGLPGPPGGAGATGATGAAGNQGPAGWPGTDGVDGMDGLPGPAGSAGQTGATGPQGPIGLSLDVWSRDEPDMWPAQAVLDIGATNRWNATQTFLDSNKSIVLENPAAPRIQWNVTGAGADQKKWQVFALSTSLTFAALNDAESAEREFLTVNRGAATAITSILFGNATDNPPVACYGTFSAAVAAGLPALQGNTGTTHVAGLSIVAGAAAEPYLQFSLNGALTAFVGCAGAANQLSTGSLTKDLVLRSDAGRIMLSISAAELLSFSGATTTGTSVPIIGANKPGPTTGAGPARWIPVQVGGAQFYIPMWAS